MNMKVSDIVVKTNVRKELGDISMLTESVKLQGVIEPLVVRKVGKEIVLLAGHRRLAAAKAAGLKEVPTHTIEVDEKDVDTLQFVENFHRKDLTIYEKIAVITEELLRRGWKLALGEQSVPAGLDEVCKEIAQKTGTTIREIKQLARLAFLPAWAKKLLENDNLTTGQALMILQLPPKEQERFYKYYYKLHQLSKPGDKIPSSDMESFIERMFGKDLSKAPFDLELPYNSLPCVGCEYNSSTVPELLPDPANKGICRNAQCYRSKCQAVSTELKNEVLEKHEDLPFVGYFANRYSMYSDGPKEARGYPIRKAPSAAELKAIADKKNPGIAFAIERASEGHKPKVVWVTTKGVSKKKQAKPGEPIDTRYLLGHLTDNVYNEVRQKQLIEPAREKLKALKVDDKTIPISKKELEKIGEKAPSLVALAKLQIFEDFMRDNEYAQQLLGLSRQKVKDGLAMKIGSMKEEILQAWQPKSSYDYPTRALTHAVIEAIKTGKPLVAPTGKEALPPEPEVDEDDQDFED